MNLIAILPPHAAATWASMSRLQQQTLFSPLGPVRVHSRWVYCLPGFMSPVLLRTWRDPEGLHELLVSGQSARGIRRTRKKKRTCEPFLGIHRKSISAFVYSST